LRIKTVKQKLKKMEFIYKEKNPEKKIQNYIGEIPTKLHKNNNDRFLQFKTLN
jgi:hypothetical protein